MILRWLISAVLISSASICAAAGWPKLDSDQSDSLLSANQAFQLMPVQHTGRELKLEWVIAPGYFLYRNRIHADIVEPAGSQAVTLGLPPAQSYNEAGQGIVQVYRNDLRATIKTAADAKPQRLRVRYQGCSDSGVCYPPQTRILELKNSP